MYFDRFGFVSAKKKKKITRAINRQTVVVTSLKMASLDDSKLARSPQIDILCKHRLEFINLSHVENPQAGAICS